jgi:hypothetical protein
MKDLDKFNDEERKHLSYLGSMLNKPLNDFDAEVQRLMDEGPEYPNRKDQGREETND